MGASRAAPTAIRAICQPGIAGDDGAVLDLGRDRGPRHVSGAGIGLQPGERGCGRQDGGGQADQDGGDTADVTDGVHDGLLFALG